MRKFIRVHILLRKSAATFAVASGIGLATAAAADAPLRFDEIDLTDGRILHNVVVKSYDAEGDRILVIADRHAQFIPLKLIPNPVSQRLRETAPRSGQNLSLVAQSTAPTATSGAGTSNAATGPTPSPTATMTAASIAARKQAAITPSPLPVPSPTPTPTVSK